MQVRTPTLQSRLPNVGTTIFTVMSALAATHDAVNLGQGFPDFECDPKLLDAVNTAMRAGHNQYPPMPGIAALREAVAGKIEALYGARYDAGSEITVTAGATQAIITAVLAVVHPGDEVIVLEPCYDSYAPNIELAGGRVVRVALTPGTFRPDFAAIGAALNAKTRAIIVNSPHNPSATVWTRAEMQQLAALLEPTETLLISDEVYEHMVFDGAPADARPPEGGERPLGGPRAQRAWGRQHVSASSIPSLAARSFVVSSFGKTFHVTGWKVGTVAAPAALSAEFRKVHQFNVFTVNTPMQHALAAYLADAAPYRTLPAFYQAKRDLFRTGLANTRLRLLPSEGSYFQCVDYSAVSELGEEAFCRWLTSEVGVAAIPLSAFYADGRDQHIARLCFAKRDDTLRAALDRLAKI